MQTVKLCSDKILQFLTEVPSNAGCLYYGRKMVVVVGDSFSSDFSRTCCATGCFQCMCWMQHSWGKISTGQSSVRHSKCFNDNWQWVWLYL